MYSVPPCFALSASAEFEVYVAKQGKRCMWHSKASGACVCGIARQVPLETACKALNLCVKRGLVSFVWDMCVWLVVWQVGVM